MSDKPARTLYFDVTQLVHWPGKLTGIPRVMNELATRFSGETDTVFVTWVKEIQQFCELDFAHTMQRTEGIIYRKAGARTESSGQSVNQQQIAKLKKQLLHIAKAVVKRGARFTPELAQRMRQEVARLRANDYKIVAFQPGDRLFIPWGEWWDPRFSQRLVDLHTDGVQLIHVVHDIGTMVCPQFFEQVAVNPSTYNSQVLPIADLVLAVSENTKRELTAWLKASKLHVPSIRVFRNGEDLKVSKTSKPTDAAFKQARLKGGDFILTVGTIELKKNHLLYYYAYKLAKARGVELPKLVVVGRKGWMGDVATSLMSLDPEVKDKFVLLHDASDEELGWLYDACSFTVIASFHEGWGIPIAESLARGVPCLCSNTSSMTEIAEDFVEHFSPASADELLAAMQRWLKPSELAAARKKAERYKPFSWDDTFKQIATYIKEMP